METIEQVSPKKGTKDTHTHTYTQESQIVYYYLLPPTIDVVVPVILEMLTLM